MAQLFKNKTLRAELREYPVPEFAKKMEIVKSWYESYNNGSLKKKTETQCEQAFNQSFFVEVLGYKAFPNEVYTIDPKAATETGGQKPDAILGYFSHDTKRVAAVVEIKDVNTPLDKSQQREGNLSPIQQAFKYKPQFKDCSFVIATNFFELRLLKDNQLDYERFTLAELVSEEDDYFVFKKFYFLLNAENFVTKQGITNTERILSTIRIEEEEISKAFYKEYRKLRQELIRNIVEHNAIKRETFPLAVEKAQKVIDRIVFTCFCEDLGLLPENKLQEVIFHTEKLGLTIPVWDILKGFFTAIDKGSDKLGIPNGYNGELFKEDVILNAFKIEDAICKKFTDFGKYDFAEDLSVNILGHIFEQSISDIEELKNVATTEEMDQAISKRKKDGIFYTPDYIVDYIVKNTLGAYLQEHERKILEKNGLKEDIEEKNYNKRAIKAYTEYQDFLHNVKVLDPACGSGAFLVKVLDYLLAENKRVASLLVDLQGIQSDLFGLEEMIKGLLQNNIYGVDLNQESVEITKLSLWLKTAHKGEKLVTLKDNIKCGNSLIEDEAVAGTKAFSWKKEFEDIFNKGGFDVIVGNPPYVYAREKISEAEKEYYYKNFQTSEYQVNTFVLFMEQSMKLLHNEGRLGFIVPNSLLKISSISKLRKYLLEHSAPQYIVQLFGTSFEGVNVETIIAIFKKGIIGKKCKVLDVHKPEELATENYKFINCSTWKDDDQCRFQVASTEDSSDILMKMKKGALPLEQDFFVSTGLKAYQAGKGNPKQTKEDVENRPFDCDHKIDENTYPYLDGKDIGRNTVYGESYFLRYGEHLAEPRKFEVFVRPRILIREITGKHPRSLVCTYTDDTYLNNLSIINVLSRTDSKENLHVLLLILNSALMSYYFIYSTPKSNRKMFPKLILRDLKEFPIRLPDETKSWLDCAKKIETYTAQLSEQTQRFIGLIKQEFGIERMSRKADEFYNLEFDEFFGLLKIKNLGLEKKAELMEFFEKQKKEIGSIRIEIDRLDSSIDEMVFDLYKLTPEEREMVLKASTT